MPGKPRPRRIAPGRQYTKGRQRRKDAASACSHGNIELKKQGLCGARLFLFDTLDSTNTWVMNNAAQCRHGDVVVAKTQTQGRGRFERPWLAVSGKSLTLSVCLDPNRIKPDQLHALGPLAAIAVRRTLSQRRIPAQLKWPNDVLVAGKKISGILIEQTPHAIVLGVGINLSITHEELLRTGLAATATSVLLQCGRKPRFGVFLSAFLRHLETALASTGSPADEWNRYDALTGRSITLHTTTDTVTGRYAGLTADWRLTLRLPDGSTTLHSSGDVTLKPRLHQID